MENKTIEYKGKVYEIGKYYLFGNYEDEMVRGLKLKTINTEDDDYPFIDSYLVEYGLIKELPSSDNFGTITDAPVELEDGDVYIFYCNNNAFCGFYSKEFNSFSYSLGGLRSFSIEECTNIRKMEVVKDEH